MSDEVEKNLPPSPSDEAVNAAWLADAIASLRTRGGVVSQLGCMGLPTPIFNELCERIILAAGNGGIAAVVEWLHGEMPDAPVRSSVYRFAGYLREEYRTARSLDNRRRANVLAANIAEGVPTALAKRLNVTLAERLGDILDDYDDGMKLDSKTLASVIMGVRTVNQTEMDERKTDKAIEKADAQIEKLQLQIREMERKFEQAAKTLQTQANNGVKITDEYIAEMRRAMFGGASK